jgi:hypothetical protein
MKYIFRFSNSSQNVIVLQDNSTLWRLYYYIGAVEKARMLPL